MKGRERAITKRPINPDALAPPVGFAHGWLVEGPGRRTLYLAGQCGHDRAGAITAPGDLVGQLERAMANVAVVLEAASMDFDDVVQLDLYVRSRNDYAAARRALGAVWKRFCGRHYPAMALLEVAALLDPAAVVEIQGIAEGEPR